MVALMTDEQKLESFILIKFAEPGSALFEVYYNNITPGQVFACIPFLEVRAKNDVITKENEKSENQLAVPRPGIVVPK